MAFDRNAFVAELLNGATVDDSTKEALLAAFANPVVTKNAEDLTLRQSDYSRQQAELKKQIQSAADYHAGLVKWEAEAKAALETERQRVRQKLVDEGVHLDDPGTTKPQADVVTKEEFQKMAQEYVAYTNAVMTLGQKHYKEFGEVLDTAKLMEASTRDQVNINIAYDRLVQPKREEIQQANLQKQLAEAREQGKAEALANLNIPSGEVPFQDITPHAADNLLRNDKSPEYGGLAAVKAWQEMRKKGTPIPF